MYEVSVPLIVVTAVERLETVCTSGDGVDVALGLEVVVIVALLQLPWEQTSVEAVTVFHASVDDVVVPNTVVSEFDGVVSILLVELLLGTVILCETGILELPDETGDLLDEECAASELWRELETLELLGGTLDDTFDGTLELLDGVLEPLKATLETTLELLEGVPGELDGTWDGKLELEVKGHHVEYEVSVPLIVVTTVERLEMVLTDCDGTLELLEKLDEDGALEILDVLEGALDEDRAASELWRELETLELLDNMLLEKALELLEGVLGGLDGAWDGKLELESKGHHVVYEVSVPLIVVTTVERLEMVLTDCGGTLELLEKLDGAFEALDTVLGCVPGPDVVVIVYSLHLSWEHTWVETVTVFQFSVADVVVPYTVVSEGFEDWLADKVEELEEIGVLIAEDVL